MRTRQSLSALSLPSAAAALLLAGPALADPAPSESPDVWGMTLEELQDIGLGQRRADPIPVPADSPPTEGTPSAPQQGGAAPAGTIFVNFDGAQLSGGSDNSTTDTTQIGQLAGSFAAYGQGSKRDAVMQAVRADWAPFNIGITDTRPGSGQYTMNMTGPTNPFGGGILGIAPLDCNDQQTHNNITYAFHSENDGFSAAITATTIGQEVAHSYGLEHVDAPGDVMNPVNAGGDASFTDVCIPIVGGANCGAQHSAQCGSGGQQNSYQELLALFGPSTPDTALPTVAIVDPVDGQQFAIGSDFAIAVEAADDVGVQEIVLFNNGEEVQADTDEPWGWDVANVPEGEYEFYVEATDLSGNQAQSAVITVVVTANPEPPPSDGDGGGEGDGDGDGDEGGGEGDDDGEGDGGGDDGPNVSSEPGSLPEMFGQNSDGEGESCACTTRGARHGGPTPTWLLGLLALGAVRRRP